MISIIVSSYKEIFFDVFVKSVKETIGVPYEIVKIHNPGAMGICEAYNQGAAKANFDLLLFVHEDLQFLTKDWGRNLVNILRELNVGIVGLAGTVYKTRMVSGWYHHRVGEIDCNRYNIFQRYKFNDHQPIHQYLNPLNEKLSKVVVVDGVFMAVRKSIWKEVKFDESINGFHAYDLDYSLSVGMKYQNVVTYDILVDHFSEGFNNRDWIVESIKVNKKHLDGLPKSCIRLDESIKKKLEFANLIFFIDTIKLQSISRIDQLRFLSRILFTYKSYLFSPRIIFYTLKSLIKK